MRQLHTGHFTGCLAARTHSATYLLIDRQRPVPTHLPQGKLIRTPLQKVVLTSAIHAALLTKLGAGASIKGLADTDYIVSPQVKALLRTGTKNIGSSMRPNTELIRTLQADAIFVSPFENAGFGGLEQLNIPLIICADYMKTSPLGRAEWMRFYGRLVGLGEKADSLFQATVATYKNSANKRLMPKHPVQPYSVIYAMELPGTNREGTAPWDVLSRMQAVTIFGRTEQKAEAFPYTRKV